jgi:hypothetical protein
MAKPEAGLWDYLRPWLHGVHYSRIESLETSPGFPDVHYTINGVSGTIELKCQPRPSGSYPFAGVKKGLRRTQRTWISEELLAGGKVLLILQAKATIFFVRGHFWRSLDHFTLDDISDISELIWTRGGEHDSLALLDLLMN